MRIRHPTYPSNSFPRKQDQPLYKSCLVYIPGARGKVGQRALHASGVGNRCRRPASHFTIHGLSWGRVEGPEDVGWGCDPGLIHYPYVAQAQRNLRNVTAILDFLEASPALVEVAIYANSISVDDFPPSNRTITRRTGKTPSHLLCTWKCFEKQNCLE